MGNNFVGQMVVVLTGIIGVAIVATLVSKNAQTPQVIGSFFDGFSKSLNAATGPVTGGGRGSMSLPSLGSLSNFGGIASQF